MSRVLQTVSSNLTNKISETQALSDHSLVSIQAVYSDLTPVMKSFIDGNVTVVSDTIEITNHGFITGLLGRLTTTGVLPSGLTLATDYFIIVVDSNNIKLANSYSNSIDGTAIDITSASGTGTHTFTPTALNAVLKVQSSVDNVNFVDVTSKTVTITTSGSVIFNIVDFCEPFCRCVLTQTSGQGVLDLQVHINLKK